MTSSGQVMFDGGLVATSSGQVIDGGLVATSSGQVMSDGGLVADVVRPSDV